MMTRYLKSLLGMAVLGVFFTTAIFGANQIVPAVIAQDHRHSSVTGFYGVDDEGIPVADRRGIMLVFDGPIKPESVSVNTFRVSLNDGTFAEVINAHVDGPYVFVRLVDELTSDATPIVGIADGEEVEDLAGNSTNQRKFGFAQVKDGIAPRLTVTLSGGSGTRTGDEGPDRLTKDTIDIRITSDEPLQGAPRVLVVCENLSWTERDGSSAIERDIEDFIANRNGPVSGRPQEPPGTSYTCSYDTDDDGMDDAFELTEDVANSRPGQAWELTWRNPTGSTRSLTDGELAVVAYGRDRSRYERFGVKVSNWATAKGGFGFDTRFGSEALLDQVKIHPPDGSVIRERRPFVLLEFAEATSVKLASVVFDGEEIGSEFEAVRSNEFVYWPLSIHQGQHSVLVEANDSAGNRTEFESHFETTQRGDFVLPLVSGWNAVSIPADPIDPAIENVFTDPAIEAVASWDPYGIEQPWAVSIRDGDVWVPWQAGHGVNEIHAGLGYWVKSSSFIKQPIGLTHGTLAQEKQPTMSDYGGGCGSSAGWFFVGVTDVNGDQTQDHFGEPLKDDDNVVLTVGEYLSGNVLLGFKWDPIEGQYLKLEKDDAVLVGEGIWYYGGSRVSCP